MKRTAPSREELQRIAEIAALYHQDNWKSEAIAKRYKITSTKVADYLKQAEELQRIAEIAALYHQDNSKQDAIARQYKITQAKVSAYLKMAKECGMVRTEIEPYFTKDLVGEMRRRFPHVKEVIIRPTCVVPEGDGDAALLEVLGTACAHSFLQHVHHGATLGVSCGVAVDAFGRALSRYAAQGEPMPVACAVYSLLTLMVETTQGFTPASLVANLTRWLPDATGHAFHLPHDPSQGIDAYTENPSIKRLVDALPTLQYYIIGIGYIAQQSVLSRIGPQHQRVSYEFNALIDRLQLIEILHELGAVGESIYQPFNEKGELLIDHPALAPLRKSTIFLSLRQLQQQVATNAASIIAIAGGPLKHRAVHAALKAKFFNVLVTDSETAEYLLRQDA